MNPDELIAALKGLPIDQLKQVLTACGVQMSAPGVPDAAGAPQPPAAAPAVPDNGDPLSKFASDPNVPDWGKEMMSAFSSMTKRFGAAEAAVADTTKKADEMSAFSASYQKRQVEDHKATVTRDVIKAVGEGRLEYRDKDDKIAAGLTKSNAMTFSAGDDKGKTHYESWRDELLSRPANASFSQSSNEPADDAPDEWVEKVFAGMRGNREPAYKPAAAAK